MSYPLIIIKAIAYLNKILSSDFFLHDRSGKIRSMRPERIESIKILLICMLKSACFQFDGAICRVKDGVARPLTVPELAALTGLSQRNVERCLADLKDLGLLDSKKQHKQMSAAGLLVSPVLRVFTQKFWRTLGLWSLFVEAVQYATNNLKLKFKKMFKVVGNISKSTQAKAEAIALKEAMNCPNHKRGQKCWGGRAPVAVCAMCKRMGLA